MMVERKKWAHTTFGKTGKKVWVLISPPKKLLKSNSKRSNWKHQVFLKHLNSGSLPLTLHCFWHRDGPNRRYPNRLNLHAPCSEQVHVFKGKINNINRPQEAPEIEEFA